MRQERSKFTCRGANRISSGNKVESLYDDHNRPTAVLFENSGGTLQKTLDDSCAACDRLIYEGCSRARSHQS
jgi:hypothetical protein